MFSTVTPKKLPLFAVVFACSCLSLPSIAQDGTLDATFGTNGKAITNVAGVGDMGISVGMQSTGKIVLGGTTVVSSEQNFALVRYLANGKVDSSFGINGRAVAVFNGISLSAIKLQPDDKIVAAGYVYSGTNIALMRFTADGIVDSSFGVNGRVLSTINGDIVSCNAIEIQDDGKIIVDGSIGCDVLVCRFKTDGTFDSSFGTNGIKIIDAGGCDKANAIAIQADKKIIIAGYTADGALAHFLVGRIDASGNIDSSFGTNGLATTDIRQTYNQVTSCAIQPDGKIVIGGSAKYFSTAFGIARYTSNGIIDSTFGTNGKAEYQFPGNSNNPNAVALQADGKIVFSGWINDGGALEIAMLRYKTGGTIDSSFGLNGAVTTGNGNGIFGYSLVIQPDAKILVGGYTYYAASGNDFAVVRYNVSSVLPVQLSFFTATAVKNAVALNWVTASEINNSYFTVERSGNNSNFTAIGIVPGKGNATQPQQYSYVDAQPLNGDNFYRLKQVDKDGRYSYSKTVRVTIGNAPYIIAYPNPAVNTVKIGGLTAASLAIVDASGKTIRQYNATGSGYTMNIQNLAAGIYFIRVQQGGKITTLKLVKE
ncbi:MAG TPA: T9SS type A sorting domain-containing protein [Chitinophagaceae bacterium]|nr:T9SS type A sorting domain-containing protein [Chitinophagaceae bacterium]